MEEKSSSKADRSQLEKLLEPFRRQAWFPKTTEQKSSPVSSKFSGVPALSKEESWPCCPNCQEPLQLFLQLNSKDIPEAAGNTFGHGFLQVFYCTNHDKDCEVECEAFFPFSKSTMIRVVNYSSEDISSPAISPVEDAFPEKEILGWIVKDDCPNWEELEDLGCTLTEDQIDFLCDLEYPQPKDKLFGWPYWVQGVEYPDCPECGNSMNLIFQIDSEDNLPYMFGDVGCAHVTQCKEHRDQLAIAWACC